MDEHGGNPPCWYCGRESETTDHILPRARGGSNHQSNLLDACRSCNSSKRDRTPREWREALELREAGRRQLPGMKFTVPQLRYLRDRGIIETARHVFWGERNRKETA